MRKAVEETLNALLDEEASELVGAGRYERAAGREAYRSGHYAGKLLTGAGGGSSSACRSSAGRPSRWPPQGYDLHVGVLARGVAAGVGLSGDIELRGIVGVHWPHVASVSREYGHLDQTAQLFVLTVFISR